MSSCLKRVPPGHAHARPSLSRRVVAEGLGTALLLAAVVGSGIMGERLAGGNVAVALLANTLATGAALGGCVPDAMTLSGAQLLWPVARRRVWMLPAGWRLRTGGGAERVLLVALSVCVVYLLASAAAGA